MEACAAGSPAPKGARARAAVGALAVSCAFGCCGFGLRYDHPAHNSSRNTVSIDRPGHTFAGTLNLWIVGSGYFEPRGDHVSMTYK